MSVGPVEIAVVFVLFVLLFGAKRLPEAGRSLGTGLREFKQGLLLAREPFELAGSSLDSEEGVQAAHVDRT